MIRSPKRSVTRFFIPMIDVLTLLFCIFLLMPFVKSNGQDNTDGSGDSTNVTASEGNDPARLQVRLQETEKELERLRNEKRDITSRLDVRTLEIDRDTGDLLYYDPKPIKISSKLEAANLIERNRDEARKASRELYYLFLFPRDPESAGLPTRAQEEAYKDWFHNVPFGIDNPRGRR